MLLATTLAKISSHPKVSKVVLPVSVWVSFHDLKHVWHFGQVGSVPLIILLYSNNKCAIPLPSR